MSAPSRRRSRFATTRWTLVLAAGDAVTERSREALAELYLVYWPPLYSYLLRRGHSREDAQDLTQGFFERLLERRDIRVADPAHGRFRSFLLTALKRYVINEYERKTAARRGGPVPPLALDFDDAEQTWMRGMRSDDTPEAVFNRNWAALCLDRALQVLRAEYHGSGKQALADTLLPYLTDGIEHDSYRAAAEALGMNSGAVRVAVHRLRRRFGQILRRQIADTVSAPDEIDDEIRQMIRALAS